MPNLDFTVRRRAQERGIELPASTTYTALMAKAGRMPTVNAIIQQVKGDFLMAKKITPEYALCGTSPVAFKAMETIMVGYREALAASRELICRAGEITLSTNDVGSQLALGTETVIHEATHLLLPADAVSEASVVRSLGLTSEGEVRPICRECGSALSQPGSTPRRVWPDTHADRITEALRLRLGNTRMHAPRGRGRRGQHHESVWQQGKVDAGTACVYHTAQSERFRQDRARAKPAAIMCNHDCSMHCNGEKSDSRWTWMLQGFRCLVERADAAWAPPM